MQLDGRSAIVTGGAGGLGSAVVRRLTEGGAGVAVFDRDLDRGQALVAELDGKAVAVGGDVNDDDAVQQAIEAASSVGVLSVVVNVAGGGSAADAPSPVTAHRTTSTPSSPPWR